MVLPTAKIGPPKEARTCVQGRVSGLTGRQATSRRRFCLPCTLGGPNRNPPSDVAYGILLQALGLHDFAPSYSEGVVPESPVAQGELLVETYLEGEGGRAIVSCWGSDRQADSQWRQGQRHSTRCRTGKGLLIARIVGEGHSDSHGRALFVLRQGIAGLGGALNVGAARHPLVGEDGVTPTPTPSTARHTRPRRPQRPYPLACT